MILEGLHTSDQLKYSPSAVITLPAFQYLSINPFSSIFFNEKQSIFKHKFDKHLQHLPFQFCSLADCITLYEET